MDQPKLFERLVTKFSIKALELANYLGVSKATIYNYRNADTFSVIPNDKQYKIFYLFGKETLNELVLLLDETDKDCLNSYSNRIEAILAGSKEIRVNSTLSLEELINKVDFLQKENSILKEKNSLLQKFESVDYFSLVALLSKLSSITNKLETYEYKELLDYLNIFEKYKNNTKE